MSLFSPPGAAPAPARDAATVVLLRDGAAGLETLLVRRPRGARFMADAFVFPGGRVDDADLVSHPVRGEASLAPHQQAMAADEGRAVACCVAAIREVFEEIGVLLAVDAAGRLPGAPGCDADGAWLASARGDLRAGRRGFREILAEPDLALDLSGLAFFARWVTPAVEPRRFDARFFLARMPTAQVARHDPDELVEQRWAAPEALVAEHDAGRLKLPPPTLWHLADLARQPTTEAAFAWAAARTVATVQPKLLPVAETLAIVLPWDPEYAALPGAGEAIPSSHPVAGEVTRYLLREQRWEAQRG